MQNKKNNLKLVLKMKIDCKNNVFTVDFFVLKKALLFQIFTKKQWVTSQPPIAHFNLNLNYEKFICLFTLQK